jgi:hypothetical protein
MRSTGPDVVDHDLAQVAARTLLLLQAPLQLACIEQALLNMNIAKADFNGSHAVPLRSAKRQGRLRIRLPATRPYATAAALPATGVQGKETTSATDA